MRELTFGGHGEGTVTYLVLEFTDHPLVCS